MNYITSLSGSFGKALLSIREEEEEEVVIIFWPNYIFLSSQLARPLFVKPSLLHTHDASSLPGNQQPEASSKRRPFF